MKVCCVCLGVEAGKTRLQPACYLVKICNELLGLGIDVSVISDGYPRLPQTDQIDGLTVYRLQDVRFPPVVGNPALERRIEVERPDVVLWHIGLTSFYHLRLRSRIDKPIIGIFTSPIYTVHEILRLAWRELLRNPGSMYIHILGALVPKVLVKSFMTSGPFKAMVVQSAKTKEGLVRLGVCPDQIYVLPPGVEPEWTHFTSSDDAVAAIRNKLGFRASDFLVLYLGSPQGYRGVDTLIRAVALAQSTLGTIGLLILSRGETGQFAKEDAGLKALARRLSIEDAVVIWPGFLSRTQLMGFVAACDAVAFPFKLVASGVPISVLEAMALGKPVISSFVDCIPELLDCGRGYLAKPGDPGDLARAIIHVAAADRVVSESERRSTAAIDKWPEVARNLAKILSKHANSRCD